MKRFLLKYIGPGRKPITDVEKIRAELTRMQVSRFTFDIKVISETENNMIVQAPEDELKQLIASMPNWTITEAQQ